MLKGSHFILGMNDSLKNLRIAMEGNYFIIGMNQSIAMERESLHPIGTNDSLNGRESFHPRNDSLLYTS